MKREVRTLLNKSTDSIFLLIDHFNRPYDRGRPEAVLIFLDRAFELLLKSVIVHKGGKIREKGSNETIGFEKCVRKCVADSQLKCLTEEEALTVQTINHLRDAAQHHLVDLSEQMLYLHTQAGVTLFGKILRSIFAQEFSDYFPSRVLPVTSQPPYDLATVVNTEFEDIKRLVRPGSRKRLDARARLRPLAILETSLGGQRVPPTDQALERFVREIVRGKPWTTIFPGIASLHLETEGSGLQVSLRITKSEGEPIRLVEEGTPGSTVVGVKRVNELSFYSIGASDLAKKIKLTIPKTLAVIEKLSVRDDIEYYKEIRIGSAKFKRYSVKALDYIKKELPNLNLDKTWEWYKKRLAK